VFLFTVVDVENYAGVFCTLGVMVGAGGGLLYVPAISIQALHWREHSGLAMGIVYSGTYLLSR
jgi:hypothetical protein